MPEVPEMTQIPTEGDKVFPTDTENDNSADSSSGKETTPEGDPAAEGEGNSDDKNKDPGAEGKGFADHPAWKEREEVHKQRFNEQESRHVNEIAKLREEFEAKITGLAPKGKGEGEAVKIPSWFGGNEQQWAEFQDWNKTLVEEAKTKAIGEISTREKAESDKITEATRYFEESVTAIEGDKELNPEGVKVDRNKLLKVAQDFDLVDSKGRWNYKAAWRFLRNASSKANANVDEKKKLADASVRGNRPEEKPQKVMTSEDFKKPGARPW